MKKSRTVPPPTAVESPGVRHLPLVDLLVDTRTELVELAVRSGLQVLNRRVVEQMLVGVATRGYARSLEPVPAPITSRGTSKSAVSRRFVAKTTAQLAAWQSAPLDALDLVALLIDGVHLGDHCLIVALGIAADGQKHALGLWDGSTENATVCQGLLANLQSRGLRTDRSLLVILDGSGALRKAVRATFGDAALVQLLSSAQDS